MTGTAGAARPLEALLKWPRGPLVVSDWVTLEREQLAEFTRATLLTPEAVDLTTSSNNRLGPDLIDGCLLVGLVVHFFWRTFEFGEQGAWALNYGFDRIRLPAPAFVGDRVRDHVELLDAIWRRPGQILVSTRHTFEIEGRSKPVLVADWLALMLTADAEVPQ